MHNVIEFPTGTKYRDIQSSPSDTPDDIFLKQLHSLPPLDQEMWRAYLDLACKLLKAGYQYDMEVFKKGERS